MSYYFRIIEILSAILGECPVVIQKSVLQMRGPPIFLFQIMKCFICFDDFVVPKSKFELGVFV